MQHFFCAARVMRKLRRQIPPPQGMERVAVGCRRPPLLDEGARDLSPCRGRLCRDEVRIERPALRQMCLHRTKERTERFVRNGIGWNHR